MINEFKNWLDKVLFGNGSWQDWFIFLYVFYTLVDTSNPLKLLFNVTLAAGFAYLIVKSNNKK